MSEYDSYSAVRDAIVEKRGWINTSSGGRYIILKREDLDDLMEDMDTAADACSVMWHMDATDTHQVIMTDKEE